MNKSKVVKEIFEWAEMLAVSVCVVLMLMTLVVRHSPVTGHSMYPTLIGAAATIPDHLAAEAGKNDVLLISDLFYTPKSGDIVVTQANGRHMEDPLVKRVIAVGGQSLRIDFEDWSVYVDGEKLDEPYVNKVDSPMNVQSYDVVMENCIQNEDGSYVVPEGYIFCMGDNRNGSADSRQSSIGLIDERLVVGKVLFRVFPFDRIGAVE